MSTTRWKLALGVLLSAVLIQRCAGVARSGPEPDDDGGEEFARRAADALDSTLALFRDGLRGIAADGSRIGDMVVNLTESIGKMLPRNDAGAPASALDLRQRLRDSRLRANRTLLETL